APCPPRAPGSPAISPRASARTPSALGARPSSDGARTGRAASRAGGRSGLRADGTAGSHGRTGDRGRSDTGGGLCRARWLGVILYGSRRAGAAYLNDARERRGTRRRQSRRRRQQRDGLARCPIHQDSHVVALRVSRNDEERLAGLAVHGREPDDALAVPEADVQEPGAPSARIAWRERRLIVVVRASLEILHEEEGFEVGQLHDDGAPVAGGD